MMVAAAAATPKGSVIKSGLSRLIVPLWGVSLKVTKAWIRTARLAKVCFTRRRLTISTTAMSPAMRIVPRSTTSNLCGPRNAPNAPISFQSPAPRPRNTTKGKSNASANPAPCRPALVPGNRQTIVFKATPSNKAGTVSQFGILLERQSSHPAHTAKSTARPNTALSILPTLPPPPVCLSHVAFREVFLGGASISTPNCYLPAFRIPERAAVTDWKPASRR